MLVHNKLTMNSGFDMELLNMELEDITDFDMADFGFAEYDFGDLNEEPVVSKYSSNVKIPQYEPKGEEPEIEDLVNTAKTDELIEEIDEANIDEDIKAFLRTAAQRHSVFNYRNIAEFYAHQNREVQKLMEKSALVIIDVDDAIANGYMKLTNKIYELLEEEE